ncbi:MAG TPA: DUF4097 family beta strand repeat-containing protein [Gemmatimonadaceae bacterium]|nr:DUF4097 family beta strand repeat-containing protein [Gemmatimonadaceae bacterium]
MTLTRALALVSSTLLLTNAVGAQERFTLSGQEVSVYNIAGTLHIAAGTGTYTEVEVTRLGRDSGELSISTPSRSSLRVIYPRDEISYPGHARGSQSTVSVTGDGTFGNTRGERTVRISSSDRAGPDAMEAAANIVVRLQPGARLTARTVIGETRIESVNGALSVTNTSGSITARGTRGELELRTASGDIDVTDAEGAITLRTASGSVDVDNARGASLTVKVASGRIEAKSIHAGAVLLETASGAIRADRVASDSLRLSSASGSITVRGATAADVQARTSSGSLDVELAGMVRSAQVRSASGSVRLQLPAGSDVALELRSASGGVHLDAPAVIVESRRGYTSANLGSGAGRVSASSSSGSVRVSAR